MEEYKKKYEEIIKSLKEAKESMGGYTFSSVVDKIIPELKESEDEKIREHLLKHFSNKTKEEWNGMSIKDIIIWLKKQGEPQVRTGSEWVRTIDDACEHRYAEEYSNGEYCHQQSFRWGFQEGVDWLEKQGIIGNINEKLRAYREYLVKETERWHKKEENKTLRRIDKQDCIGHANAYISARSKFEDLFNYDSWLKRQGEQKPVDKVEPKFKIEKDKWYICIRDLDDNYGTRAFSKGSVYHSTKDETLIPDNSNVPFEIKYCVNNYFRPWTIQDAKDGDVLYSERGSGVESIHLVSSWKKVDGENTLCSVCSYRIEDDEIITGGLGAIWWHGVQDPFFPATKEQRDLLFQKMKEAGYEWDTKKKELRKIEQNPVDLNSVSIRKLVDTYRNTDEYDEDGNHKGKPVNCMIRAYEQGIRDILKTIKQKDVKPVWSEEDYAMIEAAINFAHEYGRHGLWVWLKSLKEKYTWKPSDEQMEALNDAVRLYKSTHFDSYHYKIESLYEYLKKLKGE